MSKLSKFLFLVPLGLLLCSQAFATQINTVSLRALCHKALDKSGQHWSQRERDKSFVEAVKRKFSEEQCHVFVAPWLAPY